MPKSSRLPRMVIVGGGAGGLELATRLGHSLGKKKRAEILLIDSALTHVWKPLLHEIAVGTLDSNQDELNFLAHACAHGYEFQLGEMMGLNREKRCIILRSISDESGTLIIAQREVEYDYLVIAVGCLANTFNVPGALQHCCFLDSREQADAFHQALVKRMIQYRQLSASSVSQPLATAIIGAGASGVELAAEMVTALEQAQASGLLPKTDHRIAPITLIESGERILGQLPARIADQIHKRLVNMGIEVLTNHRVIEVTSTQVHTDSGRTIDANLTVWVAGVKAPDWLAELDGLTVNSLNQLHVKPTLQTQDDERIFALGDCCCFPLGNGKCAPTRAQVAHQQAMIMHTTLVNLLHKKKSLPTFIYKDYGSLINLSTRHTVGSLMGKFSQSFMVEGKLARWMYLSLYQLHQIKIRGVWHWFFTLLGSCVYKGVKPRLKLH